MNKFRIFVFLFFCFCLGVLFYFVFEDKFEKTHYEKSIDAAGDWFLNVQREDGTMNYNYLYEDKTFDDDDNIVRQTCAFFSLVKIYQQTGRRDVRDAIYDFKDGLGQYVVYDRYRGKDLAYLSVDHTAKINSNALYVLTLVEMKKAGLELSERDLEDMEKFVNGIVMQASDGGGFWYTYFLDKKKNKIDYYGSGEAQLALVSYYRYFDNSREDLLNLSKENFESFFPIIYSYDFDTLYGKYFLWGLLYLKELQGVDDSLKWRLYMEKMLQKGVLYRENNEICKDLGCIVRYDAAEYAYFEGVAGVYGILSEEIWFASNESIEYLRLAEPMILSWQVMDKDDKLAYGGFCNSHNCSNIRIDYTQHAIDGVISLVENGYYLH